MSSKPLYSIFEYDVMPNYEKKIKEFMAQHPATMALPQLIDNKTFVGIEVEVESISTLLDQNPIWIRWESQKSWARICFQSNQRGCGPICSTQPQRISRKIK